MSEELKRISITSEEEAFDFLERALRQDLGDQPFSLKFENWPVIRIVLEGNGYDSSITPDMAAALVEIQQAMNRAYARAAHMATTSRGLTNEERQQIQFKAKVGKGSSLIEINLGEYAEKIAAGVVDKMGPEMITISVLGTALAAASTVAYKAFLKHRSEDKRLTIETEKAIALSQEETKRLEVFERAVRAAPALNHIRDDFDVARHEIVRGMADAKVMSLSGVPLDNESARVIAMTKRSESKEVQLNGNYFIRKVDWQIDGEVRLTVAHVDTARVFNAVFRDDSLNHSQTEIMKAAEWQRSKVYMSINATELRGEISKATIIDVSVQPDADSNQAPTATG